MLKNDSYWTKIKHGQFLIFLVVLSMMRVRAAANPFSLPEEVNTTVKNSLLALFNEDFETSKKDLETIEKFKNSHPIIALAKVVHNWWQISVHVMESDEEASAPFLESTYDCIDISRRIIKQDGTKGEGQFALGTALGLLSRWSVANRAWIAAYVRGRRAGDYSKQALKRNPQLKDAYLTLGTFNYAREIIRRNIEQEGIEADKDPNEANGLVQLRKAYNEGTYFREAAGLLLAGILTNEKPQDALPLLDELREHLPESPFVHMVLITALYNAGELERMKEEADLFCNKIDLNDYPASFLPQSFFARGLISFREKLWKDAARHFEHAFRSGTEMNPYTTWALLYQGYALDAMGQRKRAIEKYERVLKLRRRFSSHEHARDRIESPFNPRDPEMRKVEL